MKFENNGYCYCCDQNTKFVALNEWFRDHYTCSICASIPRERALMYSIETFFPGWQECVIHESSPCERGASIKLIDKALIYIPSQYYPDIKPGTLHGTTRCENLENLTFEDSSIDLHITQDVMEHIFSPDKAFREIARTLRPGGMHIFTVPLVNKNNPTEICSKIGPGGDIIHLCEPEYHGNHLSEQGSLVTRKWGYDICDYIFETSGLFTRIIYVDSLDLGIRAEFIEILISIKPKN